MEDDAREAATIKPLSAVVLSVHKSSNIRVSVDGRTLEILVRVPDPHRTKNSEITRAPTTPINEYLTFEPDITHMRRDDCSAIKELTIWWPEVGTGTFRGNTDGS